MSEFLTDAPLAGTLIATDFEGWSDELRAEFDTHSHDGDVGSRLLSQNERVRVWEIRLAPGERWNAHRHVLDYFWTAVNAGRSRQHTSDGTTREVSYGAGETRHFRFAAGDAAAQLSDARDKAAETADQLHLDDSRVVIAVLAVTAVLVTLVIRRKRVKSGSRKHPVAKKVAAAGITRALTR